MSSSRTDEELRRLGKEVDKKVMEVQSMLDTLKERCAQIKAAQEAKKAIASSPIETHGFLGAGSRRSSSDSSSSGSTPPSPERKPPSQSYTR